MNNTRLQRILTSASLVTQAFGFSTLGSLMTLQGWSDSGARIGGLLAVLTGTMFVVAAIAYWRRNGDSVVRVVPKAEGLGGRCKQLPSRGWLVSVSFSRINF
jgi:hypothetical protein